VKQFSPDIFLLVADDKGFKKPIGIVEVKKPTNSDMDHEKFHGQMFTYLHLLQIYHGLDHAFGILTNYNQWRFYWLPNSDEVTKILAFIIYSNESCQR